MQRQELMKVGVVYFRAVSLNPAEDNEKTTSENIR
jgi:hypothetical protein